MKDIKILLERLRICREVEFEKDVKLLLDMKKHVEATQGDKTKTENLLSLKKFNNSVIYVKNIYNELKIQSPFPNSYYGNVLNSYMKSDQYNNLMNYCTNDKNMDLINFFHMYLIKKNCEQNFFSCLHNRFIRSVTYSYLEQADFNRYIDSDLYFLFSYTKTFSYILLKAENINMYLIQLCGEIISSIHAELGTLKSKERYENMQLYDENGYIPHNSLIKYAYFIVEYIGKNKDYDYVNMLYSVYSCMYVFSNIYCLCSMSYNHTKAQNYLKQQEEIENKYGIENSLNNIKISLDNCKDDFTLYYKYVNQYASSDFTELSEKMLYYLSKEKLKKRCNLNSTLKDFNIVKCTSILEKLFFMEIFVENKNQSIDNEKFKSIRVNIFKKICNAFDKCPLYLDFPISHDVEHAIGDYSCKESNSVDPSKKDEISNAQDLDNLKYDLLKNERGTINYCDKEFHHHGFNTTKFNIDEAFFEKHFNHSANDNSKWKEEKEYFLKLFNDDYSDKKYYLDCIDDFYYIGIDFDDTIIKGDSYKYFYSLMNKYYKCDKKIEYNLTQDDIDFFDNLTAENFKNKKDFSPEERLYYLNMISEWYILKEEIIFAKLNEKNDISEAHSDSYHHFLNMYNNVIIRYNDLLCYYDVLKDVNIHSINIIINESSTELKLREYFMDVFLNLIDYKKKNSQNFYFDIITLNLKKELCIYAIVNDLVKIDNMDCDQVIDKTNVKIVEKEDNYSGNKYNDQGLCNETAEYYKHIEKYFNIYYSNIHEYDQKLGKYTGKCVYNNMEIKYNNYSKSDKIEKLNLNSIYDKTAIKNKVCSVLTDINHKLSCFIGDSLYDIDVMLSVDIPIFIGNNRFFLKFCEKHNIIIKPLILAAAKIEFLRLKNKQNNKSEKTNSGNSSNKTSHFESITNERKAHLNDIYDANEKVIYAANGWLEIGIFLFGKF